MSQRFKQINGASQKIDTFVEFPEELNMSPYMTSSLLKYAYNIVIVSPISSKLIVVFFKDPRMKQTKRKLKAINCAQSSITLATSTMVTTRVIYDTVIGGTGLTIITSCKCQLKVRCAVKAISCSIWRLTNKQHSALHWEYRREFIYRNKRKVLIYKILRTNLTNYCLPFFKRGFKEFSRMWSLIIRHISDCCNRSGTLSVSVK